MNVNSEGRVDSEGNLENYKGIYFNDDKDEEFYEFGAHFKYNELCKRLENLILSLPPERRGKYVYNDSENNSKSKTLLNPDSSMIIHDKVGPSKVTIFNQGKGIRI
jgi:hypothetical protein